MRLPLPEHGKGDHHTPPIETTANLIVPVICIYEIFKKVNIAGDEAQALQAVVQMKQGRVVDLTEDVALSAALISLKHKLPMADSMIFATAQAQGAILWTQDDHFEGLPGVKLQESPNQGVQTARQSARMRASETD